MRAVGNDIVELFGYSADDLSEKAISTFKTNRCPFTNTQCSKTNHDNSLIYGTCSVTANSMTSMREEVIICPKRLYADNYQIFRDVIAKVWGEIPLVVGGNLIKLQQRASKFNECVIAFGQNSGKEITVNSNGKLSMDWVLQRYTHSEFMLTAQDYVGIEIQSIDTTGNYRETFAAYSALKEGFQVNQIPNAGHGLNWANVHKRLIPQIIRKGNIYSQADRCLGFFFILPEQVYKKFDEVLGNVEVQSNFNKHTLSILTYALGNEQGCGSVRPIHQTMTKNHLLEDIALAFTKNTDPKAPINLDLALKNIIYSQA